MLFQLSRLCCTALFVLALPLAALAAKDLSAKEVGALLPEADWVIVDVRTPAEFEQGHVPGAGNADISSVEFEEILSPLNPEDEYLVYCQNGNRSVKAVQKMEKMGFKNIVHMKDGMTGWQKAGLPVSKE